MLHALADLARVIVAAMLLFLLGALVVVVARSRRNSGYVDPVIMAQLRSHNMRYAHRHERQRP